MPQNYEGAGSNRFLVPQYIDTEPKILGPVTVRQFIIMLCSSIIAFLLWKIFETGNQILGVILIVFQFMIFFVFAFAVINGQKFHLFFLNIIQTLKRPNLRVYHREFIESTSIVADVEEIKEHFVKKLPPKSRLSDISLLVDTGGAYNIEEIGGSEKIDGVKELKI